MRVRSRLIPVSFAAASLAAWVFAQPAPPAAAPKPAVATVGSRRVARDEYEARAQQALQEFAQRSGGKIPDELRIVVRRQLLESMIRLELLTLEAARLGISGSAAEAEEQLKRDPFFNPNGKFDAARFDAVKATQPQRFQEVLRGVEQRLAARKLNESLEKRFGPSDAKLREDARGMLGRISYDHLSLRRSDFSGAYPEPRESAVLEEYRRRGEEFRRPERITMSVVFINLPALADSLQGDGAQVSAWNERMKRTADSLLTAIRGGVTLETATLKFGGPRPNVAATLENFPGYWNGSEALNASLFKLAPGTLVDQPVPAKDGYLLVRVDAHAPSRVAPLREVAREIRGRLRGTQHQLDEDHQLRALYATLKDSLAGPAWRVRYAVVDADRVKLSEPSEADLERYYRGHLADYSSFDAAGGQIVAKPLSEVRTDIRTRWARDRRREAVRVQSENVLAAWTQNRRAPADEKSLTVREVGPLTFGAPVDTGAAARALADTLWSRDEPTGAGRAVWPGGYVVYQVVQKQPSFLPPFEQTRGQLSKRLVTRLAEENEQGARALFDRDPEAFSGGNVIHYSRMIIGPQDFMTVTLTRAEVEKFHRENLEKYSAPELVRARHILISPKDASPQADQAARARAQGLLLRARAGEDFARLAQTNTDDPATKDNGGDLGTFGRGAMLDAFEKAAFALQPGEISELVKTEVGYHIIECIEHQPLVAQPLSLLYANVSSDAAIAKADTIAARRADSLLHVLRTPAQALAVAKRFNLQVQNDVHRIGDPSGGPTVRDYTASIEKLRPGQFLPTLFRQKGQGHAITWVDEITPPGRVTWEEARPRALEAYVRGAGERALVAKAAELDTMLASGWSFDSLGVLWGGPEHVANVTRGGAVPGLGGREVLDSLLFTPGNGTPLAVAKVSDWVRFPLGLARIRVTERNEPGTEAIAQRVENDRRAAIEQRMVEYFDDLKKRYPVRILDEKLRTVAMPATAPPR